MEISFNHFWTTCECCGTTVICGNCGNNLCNGGVGEYADRSTCPACDSAYEMMMRDDETEKVLIPFSGWPKIPNPHKRFQTGISSTLEELVLGGSIDG